MPLCLDQQLTYFRIVSENLYVQFASLSQFSSFSFSMWNILLQARRLLLLHGLWENSILFFTSILRGSWDNVPKRLGNGNSAIPSSSSSSSQHTDGTFRALIFIMSSFCGAHDLFSWPSQPVIHLIFPFFKNNVFKCWFSCLQLYNKFINTTLINTALHYWFAY